MTTSVLWRRAWLEAYRERKQRRAANQRSLRVIQREIDAARADECSVSAVPRSSGAIR